MRKKDFVNNIVVSFAGQLIAIILGIIIPRILIVSYGSDTNGLINTIGQIFTYLALLEAGIGQATRNALFKPLTNKDKKAVAAVFCSAQRYFRRITIYYGLAVVFLSVFLPFVIKTEVNPVTIFFVVIFEGMAGVISFYYVETPSILLMADGKGYVNNAIGLVNRILGYVAKIVLAYLGVWIVLLQFAYFLITVAKVIFYLYYIRKNYSWLKEYKTDKNELCLRDRNSYVVTEITWTIFSSTDMIVLSSFLTTRIASVYSVYNMIFSNINLLLNTVYFSINYILGQSYFEDIKKYEKIHDLYNSVFIGMMTILMSIAYVLTIPFITLYTQGVTDTTYIYEKLPLLFCLVQILSWSRYVNGNLIGVAGRINKAVKINVLEAVINIVFSILFVSKYGIEGVLFATVIALPLKVIYCGYIAEKVVLKRKPYRFCLVLGLNYLFFALVVYMSQKICIVIDNYMDFIKYGVIITILMLFAGAIVNIVANPKSAAAVKILMKKGE